VYLFCNLSDCILLFFSLFTCANVNSQKVKKFSTNLIFPFPCATLHIKHINTLLKNTDILAHTFHPTFVAHCQSVIKEISEVGNYSGCLQSIILDYQMLSCYCEKRYYRFCHVRVSVLPSVSPHGTTRLPLARIFMKFYYFIIFRKSIM